MCARSAYGLSRLSCSERRRFPSPPCPWHTSASILQLFAQTLPHNFCTYLQLLRPQVIGLGHKERLQRHESRFTVKAGLRLSFKMSRHIAPVCDEMLGCHILVSNFIWAVQKGTAQEFGCPPQIRQRSTCPRGLRVPLSFVISSPRTCACTPGMSLSLSMSCSSSAGAPSSSLPCAKCPASLSFAAARRLRVCTRTAYFLRTGKKEQRRKQKRYRVYFSVPLSAEVSLLLSLSSFSPTMERGPTASQKRGCVERRPRSRTTGMCAEAACVGLSARVRAFFWRGGGAGGGRVLRGMCRTCTETENLMDREGILFKGAEVYIT